MFNRNYLSPRAGNCVSLLKIPGKRLGNETYMPVHNDGQSTWLHQQICTIHSIYKEIKSQCLHEIILVCDKCYNNDNTNVLDHLVFITRRKRSLGQGNIFTPVCHSVHRGGMRGFIWGACMVLLGGHAWFYSGACMVLFKGVCVVLLGGMHGFIWGACMVLFGGACMVLFGRACVILFGGCVWFYSGGHAWFYGGACMVFSIFSDTMRYGQ